MQKTVMNPSFPFWLMLFTLLPHCAVFIGVYEPRVTLWLNGTLTPFKKLHCPCESSAPRCAPSSKLSSAHVLPSINNSVNICRPWSRRALDQAFSHFSQRHFSTATAATTIQSWERRDATSTVSGRQWQYKAVSLTKRDHEIALGHILLLILEP